MCSPKMYAHLDAVLRPQSDQRFGFDGLTWHHLKSDALGKCGENKLRLHHCEMTADAIPWTCGKWNIDPTRQACLKFWSPAIWIEALRVREVVWIAMNNI